MTYIILFFLIAAIFTLYILLNTEPKKVAAVLIRTGPIILICFGGMLTLSRRGVIGVPLILLGVSLLRRSQMMRPPPYAEGRKSTVRSTHLEMELDHDSGEMDGQVLTGKMAGAMLSSLDETELLSLYREISGDGDSVALLESFLDRYHPDWREQQEYFHGSASDHSSVHSMTKEEAYQVLGLEPGASKEEIHKAWRRLVKAVHPDGGGSAFLTAKINAAKDILLD